MEEKMKRMPSRFRISTPIRDQNVYVQVRKKKNKV